jgi:hypothetical protein
MVELAVEGGHYSARIVARQCREDGGERTFLDGAEVVGSRGGTHVLRISM